jgi:hypothetical protein
MAAVLEAGLHNREAIMATVEELEKRLAAVEQELAELQRFVVHVADEILGAWKHPPGFLDRLRQRVREAELDEIYRNMGIVGEAPGIEKLREMMLAAGIKPEADEIIREIDAGRGE